MKTHFQDTTTPKAKYLGSPHIEKAIDTGFWALCKIITPQITTVDEEVTCEKCKELRKEEREKNPARMADDSRHDCDSRIDRPALN